MNATIQPMLAVLGLSGWELILILLSLMFPLTVAAGVIVVILLTRGSGKRNNTAPSPVPPENPAGGAQSTQIIPRKCPQCGAELKSDAPEGLCPSCLLQRGIATEGGAPPGTPAFTPPPLADLAKLFPQLEIIEPIGQGGMGAVYKARQPALDRLVALKILAPRSGGDLDFAARFAREARALAKLSHPNIVGVYDFGQVSLPTTPSTPHPRALNYFIMEYVDGPNLRQVEQSGKLSPREALEIIPQICSALQFAHDEGVVHRDIKPENVLLDKKGRVKIADFGLAKILGQEADFRLTGARDVMGTPHYMAPEQVEKPQEVDHRADIYSLGVVFYEMLTGELPLGKFDPPSQKVQVDVRLDEVVLRSLAQNPARRYQQVSQVKTEVETIAQTSSGDPAAKAAFVQEMQSRDYDLDIGSCVSRAWNLVKQNFWPMVGVNALVALILSLAGSFSYTVSSAHDTPAAHSGSLLSVLLRGPLMGALYLYYLKLVRNERPTLDTAFSGFLSRFLQLFLGSFVAGVLCFVAFLFFILPGFYFWAAWMFTLVLIVDKRLDFWAAMEVSRKVVAKHWWKLFGLMLVLVALRVVGFMFCLIGIFVAAPVVHATLLYAYEDIFNRPASGKSQATAPAPTAGASGKGFAIAMGTVAAIVAIAFLGFVSAIAIPHFVKSRRAARAVAEQGDALRSKKEDARHLAQEGWQLWNERQLDAAAQKFERSLVLDPKDVNAWNGLGWARQNAGKFQEAENAFQKALELKPNEAGPLNGLGQSYLSQGKYDEAEKFLLKAAPNAPAAWYGLARLYLLETNFTEAGKWAKKAVDLGGGDGLAQQMLQAANERELSDTLRRQIETDATGNVGAIPVEASPLGPQENATYLANEGWALMGKQWDDAAKKFQQAVQLDPDSTNAWNGLGWAQLNCRKFSEAESAFRKALALDPNLTTSLNGLAKIYLSEGRYDDAEKILLKNADVLKGGEPGPAFATWEGLARLYLLTGNFEEAKKWAQKYVDASPSNELANMELKDAQVKHLSDNLRVIIQPTAVASSAATEPIERMDDSAPKTIVLARPAINVIDPTNDVSTVSIWTDTHLEPGESVSAMVKRGTTEIQDASTSRFVNWQPDSTGTSSGLSWFFGGGLGPNFSSNEAAAALDQLSNHFAGKSITLVPGAPEQLFSIANKAGEVMTGYIAFKRSSPMQSGDRTDIKAKVHLRLSNPVGMVSPIFVSVEYAADVPPGYALLATATEGRVNTVTPSGPSQYRSTWFFNQLPLARPNRPGLPATLPPAPPKIESFEQMQARSKAVTDQLWNLQDQGPVYVIPGKQTLVFSMTNSEGKLYQGFFELAGPDAASKSIP